MAYIDGYFSRHKTTAFTFQTEVNAVNASGEPDLVWTTAIVKRGILWDTGTAPQFLSGSWKAKSDAMMALKNLTGVTDNMRVKSGSDYYNVIHAEDVSGQGKMFVVYLTKWAHVPGSGNE